MEIAAALDWDSIRPVASALAPVEVGFDGGAAVGDGDGTIRN